MEGRQQPNKRMKKRLPFQGDETEDTFHSQRSCNFSDERGNYFKEDMANHIKEGKGNHLKKDNLVLLEKEHFSKPSNDASSGMKMCGQNVKPKINKVTPGGRRASFPGCQSPGYTNSEFKYETDADSKNTNYCRNLSSDIDFKSENSNAISEMNSDTNSADYFEDYSDFDNNNGNNNNDESVENNNINNNGASYCESGACSQKLGYKGCEKLSGVQSSRLLEELNRSYGSSRLSFTGVSSAESFPMNFENLPSDREEKILKNKQCNSKNASSSSSYLTGDTEKINKMKGLSEKYLNNTYESYSDLGIESNDMNSLPIFLQTEIQSSLLPEDSFHNSLPPNSPKELKKTAFEFSSKPCGGRKRCCDVNDIHSYDKSLQNSLTKNVCLSNDSQSLLQRNPKERASEGDEKSNCSIGNRNISSSETYRSGLNFDKSVNNEKLFPDDGKCYYSNSNQDVYSPRNYPNCSCCKEHNSECEELCGDTCDQNCCSDSESCSNSAFSDCEIETCSCRTRRYHRFHQDEQCNPDEQRSHDERQRLYFHQEEHDHPVEEGDLKERRSSLNNMYSSGEGPSGSLDERKRLLDDLYSSAQRPKETLDEDQPLFNDLYSSGQRRPNRHRHEHSNHQAEQKFQQKIFPEVRWTARMLGGNEAEVEAFKKKRIASMKK